MNPYLVNELNYDEMTTYGNNLLLVVATNFEDLDLHPRNYFKHLSGLKNLPKSTHPIPLEYYIKKESQLGESTPSGILDITP